MKYKHKLCLYYQLSLQAFDHNTKIHYSYTCIHTYIHTYIHMCIYIGMSLLLINLISLSRKKKIREERERNLIRLSEREERKRPWKLKPLRVLEKERIFWGHQSSTAKLQRLYTKQTLESKDMIRLWLMVSRKSQPTRSRPARNSKNSLPLSVHCLLTFFFFFPLPHNHVHFFFY